MAYTTSEIGLLARLRPAEARDSILSAFRRHGTYESAAEALGCSRRHAIAWEDEVSGDELRDRHEAVSCGITYQAWCERRDRARAYDEAIDREEAEDRESA